MTDSPTHYDTWFSKLVAQGSTEPQAAVAVIHRFLDGKPNTGMSPVQRDEALWTSRFWQTCSDEIFHTEAFALAFAKYLGRDGDSGFTEQRRALFVAPDTCKRAIRYSKVFLSPDTARWRELHRLLEHEVKGYRGFVRECLGMSRRYMGLRRDADAAYRKLSRLPLMDLIVLASMSAFKTELPPFLGVAPPNRLIPSPEFRYPLFTEAVARLLARRLADCVEEELSITEEHIRRAFQRQMYPLLRANHFDGGLCSRNLHTFECYVDAQLRLDAFRQNEISNFCFDGFSAADQGRISEELNSAIRPLACFEPWVRSSLRGMILREYWNNVGHLQWEQGARATGAMAPADGSLPPLAKAFADLAILHDLYGLDSKIDLGGGVSVHLDQACLFLELARDNYRNTLLIPFAQAMYQHGNWAAALAEVVESAMFDGLQQRYPILFATCDEKLKMLRQFTVTDEHPSGSDAAAAALMKFWGNDLERIADPVHRQTEFLKGNFAEQPLLKLGDYVFTLPWVLTTQDIPTALINNLRRVRQRRSETKSETLRIELRLAEQMQQRGFRTVVGFEPEDGDGEPPGEIDLIAALDGHLFVFEIKSGYVRQTFEAAWIHRTATLRKAGRQLQRKIESLRLAFPNELKETLGLDALPDKGLVHGWIVDTSVDFDREKFSGYMKISMTEVIVALQDCADMLIEDEALNTLYTEEFSAARFVEVLEEELIWNAIEKP